MDWVQDCQICDEPQLGRVFRYSETKLSTTVLRIHPENEKPSLSTLCSEDEWKDWFEADHPKASRSDSGLVLLMFRRIGEKTNPGVKRVDSSQWFEVISNEKPPANTPPQYTEECGSNRLGGQRALRTLPLTKEQFKMVATKFHMHKSISRCISRADAPAISAHEVLMSDEAGQKYPSYVYNCRSSNSWPRDLALTVTYFPHCKLTFAVMFGCSVAVETNMIKRLTLAIREAAHPVLLTGLFIELERSRHISIVEDITRVLEERISEVESRPEEVSALSVEEKIRRIEARKEAWMNTMYLKNHLLSWKSLLVTFTQHLDRISSQIGGAEAKQFTTLKNNQEVGKGRKERAKGDKEGYEKSREEETKGTDFSSTLVPCTPSRQSPKKGKYAATVLEPLAEEDGEKELKDTVRSSDESFGRTNNKIWSRIQGIIHEYHEMIRECEVRVEGMSMATQWAQGETNVEIALSTGRESQHMRSIAIVTMIFLPGIFFASIFSMGFFDWSSDSGNVVSKYFWIYVVMATGLTLLTLYCWWFFGVRRCPKVSKKVRTISGDETV